MQKLLEMAEVLRAACERVAVVVRSAWEEYMRYVGIIEAVLDGRGNGAAVTLVAVLVGAAMFMSACEAGGQFDYSCNKQGFCTGEASWFVEYPVPAE